MMSFEISTHPKWSIALQYTDEVNQAMSSPQNM